MKLKVKLDPNCFLPEKAYDADAGYDLRTPAEIGFENGFCIVDTGVHIEIPEGYYGKIESKSGLNVKHGIVSCGGIIDAGYTGSIVVKLYCLHPYEDYTFKKGDKVAQLIIQKCESADFEIVDELSGLERGSNGFGSTGR